MQLSEQLLHTTIRIEASLASGGCSVGTGFFFKFCDNGKTHVPAIVTNRHVVEGLTSIASSFRDLTRMETCLT